MHRERGVSDSIEWAILTPLVLLTILGTIQVGLGIHGRTVATYAAIAAAEHASLAGASVESARALGHTVAEASGLVGVNVDVHRDAASARAVVSGTMPTFIDLGLTAVREQASRPVEQASAP